MDDAIRILDDLARPKALALRFPDLFTAEALQRMCERRKENGLEDAGGVLLDARGRFLIVVSKFTPWFTRQAGVTAERRDAA